MLTLRSNFSTNGHPSGFFNGLGAMTAQNGVLVAVNTSIENSLIYGTQFGSDQQAQVTINWFSQFAKVRVIAKNGSNNNYLSDHYEVELEKNVGNYDVVRIAKYKSGTRTVLASNTLWRGPAFTGVKLRIRVIEAGTKQVVQGYLDGLIIVETLDVSNVVTGSGYTGVWVDGNSSGVSLDDYMAGNLSVNWVHDATGTDNNKATVPTAGQFINPMKTIRHAVNASQQSEQGAVVMVRTGNYPLSQNPDFGTVTWLPGIDWDNPMMVAAYPTETPVNNYTGGSACWGFGSETNPMSYFYMHNINGTGTGRLSTSANNFMHIGNLNHHIRVHGGEMQQFPNVGVFTSGQLATSGITDYGIEYIGIHTHDNGGILPNPNNDHAFYVEHPGTLVEKCEINDQAVWGIHIQPYPAQGDYKANNCILRWNYIHHVGGGINNNPGGSGGGILVSYSDDTKIYGNIVVRNRMGIAINSNSSNADATGPTQRALVYNNTIAFNSAGVGIDIGSGSGPAPNVVNDCIVRNNILWGNAVKGINVHATRASGTTVGTDNLNWDAAATQLDPVFDNPDPNDPALDDYHLSASSTNALGIGTNLGTSQLWWIDYDGLQRPVSGAWDPGAHQFSNIGAGTTAPDVFIPPQKQVVKLVETTINGLIIIDGDNNSQRCYLKTFNATLSAVGQGSCTVR